MRKLIKIGPGKKKNLHSRGDDCRKTQNPISSIMDAVHNNDADADSRVKKRALPPWMLKGNQQQEEDERADEEEEEALENAEFALELLEVEEEEAMARKSRAEWGFYDYLGQEEEELAADNDDAFNLSDTDVAGNMSTDEALAIVRMAQAPLYDTLPYPYKRNRARVMQDLRTSIAFIGGRRAAGGR